MNQRLLLPYFLAGFLLPGMQSSLLADAPVVTNLPAIRTNAAAKPTAAERRARVEAWRKERGNLNPPKQTNAPALDPKKLSREERRLRIKAQLAEFQRRQAVSNNPAANPPPEK